MDCKRLSVFICIVNIYLQSYQSAQAVVLDDKQEESVHKAITKLSLQLEAFNLHYVSKLEENFVNIMQKINHLDANMKQLQEKAQIWDIFRHHISSWSEHIKTSDRKIDIIKKNLDSIPIIENQLQNTDFKVQKMFEKTDLINEKLNEIAKSTADSHRTHTKFKQKEGAQSWSQEDFEQTEVLIRLSKIQKTLQNTCSAIRVEKEIEGFKGSNSKASSGEFKDGLGSIKKIMTKVNNNLERIPVKEIKQLINLNKMQEKSLETATNLLQQIDERTIRIFDSNSFYFKKLLSCCRSSEHEVLSFTSNVNSLLKRVEKAIRAVEISTVVSNEKNNANRTDTNELEGSGASAEIEEETLDDKEYLQPNKTNCFQLTTGRSGVYTFAKERKLNANGRDFYKQYCEYSTEGTAWTIIQKRDNFNPPENFNRSWDDYKYGFGNLSRDFWFGNEFIHKLTLEHNMVLRIVLEDFKDNYVWVEYGTFKIQSEDFNYSLTVDEYRGAIADSFLYHNNQPFSTFNANNAEFNSSTPCAQAMGSGWWFKSCAQSNLNGIYHNEPLGNSSRSYKGVFWEHWLGDYSLKATKMMIRPKDVWFSSTHNEDVTELNIF